MSGVIHVRWSWLALVGGALAVGMAPVFVRISDVNPTSSAFWRLGLALPLFWLMLVCEQRGSRVGQGADKIRLVASGVLFGLALAAWHWSIHFTSVANATLFANMAPIFVAIGGWMFFRERFSKKFVFGLLITLFGACLLVFQNVRFSPSSMAGDLFGLLTAVLYAGYLLLAESLRKQHSTSMIMAWSCLPAACIVLFLGAMSSEISAPSDLRGWLIVIGLAVVSQAIGRSLIVFALAKLPASYSSATLLLHPVFAVFFAAYFLAESIGPWQVFGGSIVLMGVFMLHRERTKKATA